MPRVYLGNIYENTSPRRVYLGNVYEDPELGSYTQGSSMTGRGLGGGSSAPSGGGSRGQTVSSRNLGGRSGGSALQGDTWDPNAPRQGPSVDERGREQPEPLEPGSNVPGESRPTSSGGPGWTPRTYAGPETPYYCRITPGVGTRDSLLCGLFKGATDSTGLSPCGCPPKPPSRYVKIEGLPPPGFGRAVILQRPGIFLVDEEQKRCLPTLNNPGFVGLQTTGRGYTDGGVYPWEAI